MRRVVLAVVVVLVLAGCNGFTDQPTPTETLTPVSDIETTQRYPPGIDEQGVVRPDRIAEVHASLDDDRSFVLVSNRTVRYQNGTLRSLLSVRIRIATNRTHHVWARTAGPAGPRFLGRPPARAQFWSDGETYARLLERDNRTVYNTFQPPDETVGTWQYWTQTVAFGGQAGSAGRTIRDTFGSIPTSLVETVSTRNGTRLYRLTGRRHTSLAFAPADVESAANVSLTATVGSDGFVRELQLQYDAVIAGQNVTVYRRVAYRNVGRTNVTRPPWYDRAVED